jgi:hypothetical protein
MLAQHTLFQVARSATNSIIFLVIKSSGIMVEVEVEASRRSKVQRQSVLL